LADEQVSTTNTSTSGMASTCKDPLLNVLQNVFHHDNFKTNQREITECLLLNKDTLAVIPTGGGKSMCYWIPGIVSTCVTVIVTPLIALLNDQVRTLKSHDIPVCYVTSTMLPEERDYVFHELTKTSPKYKFLYVTPEFALSTQASSCFQSMVENQSLNMFIIDEAHCVNTWGNSFRPAYGKLIELKKYNKPIAAFTGTATHQTQKQIIEGLGLNEPHIFQASCNRSNLSFSVLKKNDKHAKEYVVEYVQEHHANECGIVYCLSTRDSVELAYIFKAKGLSAVYYHGKLDFFEKADNAKSWLEGRAKIMCATSAFGMGIDKPDVRFVIHNSLPRSLEDYYQEAGRAGRDGNPSACIIMFKFSDRNQLIRAVSSNETENEESIKESVDTVVSYCMSSACRRKIIMEHFDDKSDVHCERGCDNCTKPDVPLKDYTKDAVTLCQCAKEMLVVCPAITIRQLALTLRGSKAKREVEDKGFQYVAHYGAGQRSFKNDAMAITLVHYLIIKDVLVEKVRIVGGRSTAPFVTLGSKAEDLLNGKVQILLNL
jgi:RecQ family ATP-dependent DNA helicase